MCLNPPPQVFAEVCLLPFSDSQAFSFPFQEFASSSAISHRQRALTTTRRHWRVVPASVLDSH